MIRTCSYRPMPISGSKRAVGKVAALSFSKVANSLDKNPFVCHATSRYHDFIYNEYTAMLISRVRMAFFLLYHRIKAHG